MAQQIGEKGDIIKFVQKIDRKPMAEGMRVNRLFRYAVALCQHLKLAVNSAGSNEVSAAVGENETGIQSGLLQSGESLLAQAFREINPAHFAALGTQIKISHAHVLRFNLEKLADPNAGSGEKADDKIPAHIFIPAQPTLQAAVILIGNYILQEHAVVHFYAGKFFRGQGKGGGILVDGVNASVDGAWLVVFYEP